MGERKVLFWEHNSSFNVRKKLQLMELLKYWLQSKLVQLFHLNPFIF